MQYCYVAYIYIYIVILYFLHCLLFVDTRMLDFFFILPSILFISGGITV